MRARWIAVSTLLAAACGVVPAAAQTAAFSGRYRLLLTFGSSCQARIGSLSLSLSVTERTVADGSEIDGRPSQSDEVDVGEIILLRAGGRVHGPLSSLGGRTDREPLTSREGMLFLPWLVLEGSVTSSGSRPQAKGTAFGFLAAGRSDEEYPSSLASCTAADFSWSLDPE